jgi:hypothetical protein
MNLKIVDADEYSLNHDRLWSMNQSENQPLSENSLLDPIRSIGFVCPSKARAFAPLPSFPIVEAKGRNYNDILCSSSPGGNPSEQPPTIKRPPP